MNRSQLLRKLAERIDRSQRRGPLRAAIDGVDAAGKTILADELAEQLRERGRTVIRASIDGFHNPAAVRHAGCGSPESYLDASFDYAALFAELLDPLAAGGSRKYRRAVFDYRTDSKIVSPPEYAPADAILVFDGVFLLRQELRPYWEFSVFVAADFRITLARAQIRDCDLFGSAAAVRNRYRLRYIPGQELYLDREQPREYATVVIDNNDPDSPEFLKKIR